MKQYIVLIILLIPGFALFAQKERKFVREGNQMYEVGLKDTAKLDSVSFGKAEAAIEALKQGIGIYAPLGCVWARVHGEGDPKHPNGNPAFIHTFELRIN